VTLATFHSRLTTDDVLLAGVRAQLGLADAASVYVGTQPRSPRQATEVLVEPLAYLPRGEDGAGEQTEHRYLLHVWRKAADGESGSKSGLFGVVDTHAAKLVAWLDGARPFAAQLPDLICCSAAVEESTPPETPDEVERVVAVSFLVRGSGHVPTGLGDA